MRKIPTLFIRNQEKPQFVTREINPSCQWVIDGEGVATRKYDGTCVMLDESGEWWSRREVKPGKQAPSNYQPISTDPNTGKTMGWEPIAQSAFAKYHAQALGIMVMEPGTYELIGPKVNGNPENVSSHVLIPHDAADRLDAPRDFDGLVEWLSEFHGEGIVWHHPDGRMAKLKRRDFPTQK